jgi:hypothetical protein
VSRFCPEVGHFSAPSYITLRMGTTCMLWFHPLLIYRFSQALQFIALAHIVFKSYILQQMPSFVPDTFDDCPPPLGEEPSHPEHPEHLGETNLVINELLQVVINSMCHI